MLPDATARLVRRIVYTTETFDPSTRLPITIIDSTALPPPDVVEYDAIVAAAIDRLPKSSYALLFFACGAPNKPSWSWVARTYSMLERSARKRVRKIYVVHESWWVRTITQMLKGVVSAKFKSKIVHVSSLSQLAQLIDITLVNIPPAVYLHNLKIEDVVTVPRHHTPIFGSDIATINGTSSIVMPSLWDDATQFLAVTAPTVRGAFTKTDNPELLAILRNCYDRSQLLDLNDYGPHLTAALLKQYLYELPTPVLPIRSIPIPIRDTEEYTLAVFRSLPPVSQYILASLTELLVSVVANGNRTHHTASTLATCIAPSFIGLSSVSKEGTSIGIRYTRNLIDHWQSISMQVLVPVSPAEGGAGVGSGANSAPHSRTPSFSEDGTAIEGARHHHHRTLGSYSQTLVTPSHISAPLYTLSKNNSTPELRPKYSDDLIDQGPPPPPPPPRETRTSSGPSLTGTGTMGPPPVPKKPNVLQSVKSPAVDQGANKNGTPPEPPSPRKFGPRSKSVASTRRGKMVAELAKLYEEKGHTARILAKLEPRTN